MRLLSILILCLSFSLGSSGLVHAADTGKGYKLIFSTFDNTSAKNYAFLRDSIQTMLLSRLSANEKIEVVDKVLSKKELAELAENGSKATTSPNADYLLTGSIYALVNGINVQVTMYPFDASKKVLNFSQLSETPNDIIAGNDALINAILKELFGEAPVEGEAELAGNAIAGFTTTHPEADYKKGLYTGRILDSPGGAVLAESLGVKRSTTLSGDIDSMTVGDLDGDGNDEILILKGLKLKVFAFEERNIVQIDETELPSNKTPHSLNIADIDNDGKMEIYISCNDSLEVSSSILKWEGKGLFSTVSDNLAYYIKPIFFPGEGWILLGQKRGKRKVEFIKPGLFKLAVDSLGNVVNETRLPLPDVLNVFNFIFADVDGDESYEIVSIDRRNRIKLYNSTNELMWVSNNSYAGSKRHLGPDLGDVTEESSTTNLTIDEAGLLELDFVPGRLVVADLNNDGKDEIIVNEQKDTSFKFLAKSRSYNGGVISGLSWNGDDLIENWRTGKFKGYIVDHNLKVQNPDSSVTVEMTDGLPVKEGILLPVKEGILYVANIPREGSLLSFVPGISKSQISIFRMNFSSSKTE